MKMFLSILFHGFMILLTGGIWIAVLLLWLVLSLIRSSKKGDD